MEKEYDVFGIGNVLVDYIADVEDSTLKELKIEKNVMNKRKIKFIKNLESKLKVEKYSGGTVPNVLHGIANLGLKAASAGSISKDDDGELLVKDLEATRVKNCMVYKKGHTGIAMSLVTPDGERTFVVNYGVADKYKPKDINQQDLSKARYFHTTGYEFESMNKTVSKAIQVSKESNTKVSFDLGDPNVVLRNKKKLEILLKDVDVLFSNEEEAKNFTNERDPEKALRKLSGYCDTVVVKLGKEGCIAASKNSYCKVKGYEVKLVNTNGAGDGFAAGFLYGLCKNCDLEFSCKLGNLYASKIVEEKGARLSYPVANFEWWVQLLDLS